MPIGIPKSGKRRPRKRGQYWFTPKGEPTENTPTTKACAWCGKQYPIPKDKRKELCSPDCLRAKERNKLLGIKYGISLADYKELWDKQEGRCAICRRQSTHSLNVEHSHITGTVRGLCCMTCNRDILGYLDGSLDKLQSAADFFQRAHDDLQTYATRTGISLPISRLPETQTLETPRPTLVRVRSKRVKP